MKKINKHIEIAHTTNGPFSSMGIKSCLMIKELLSLHYEHVGLSDIQSIEDLDQLVAKKPDLVFIGLKRLPFADNGVNTKDIWISEYLDKKGIKYTGSNKVAIELDFNKENAKIKIKQAGLPTAAFFTALPGQHQTLGDLPLQFPLFIKPLDTGGGRGIGNDSVVNTFLEFERKVSSIHSQLGSRSMVESYLTGREFSVAILDSGNDSGLLIMPIELLAETNPDGHRILGSEIKDADTEQAIAIVEDEVREMIAALAKDVYIALGARDLGRIDIRMDANGKAYFLEANLVPGLADNDFLSYFNRACLINQGMDYETMILNIAELGLTRNSRSLATV